MRHEIKHCLKGHRNEYFLLNVWLYGSDSRPFSHISRSRSYINRKLKHYKNVAKRLEAEGKI